MSEAVPEWPTTARFEQVCRLPASSATKGRRRILISDEVVAQNDAVCDHYVEEYLVGDVRVSLP